MVNTNDNTTSTASASALQSSYPKLWEISDNDESNSNISNQPSAHMPSHIVPGSDQSFAWARSVPRTFLKITSNNDSDSTNDSSSTNSASTSTSSAHLGEYRSFTSITASSFVIAQEFALSTFFLAAHRCLVCTTNSDTTMDSSTDDTCAPCLNESRYSTSLSIFGITFPLIAIWTMSARAMRNKQQQQQQSKQQSKHKDGKQRKTTTVTASNENTQRVFYRTIDAIMIACMLRYLSSVLRTLTASYSSDTVNALSVGGMILHLLSCDYKFANGIRTHRSSSAGSGSNSSSNGGSSSNNTMSSSYEHGRPLFMGGTISINCVFFSASLLASRCSTDSSTYVLLMASIVSFAYFPEARHTMALAFGHTYVYCTFLTTCAIGTASYLILNNNTNGNSNDNGSSIIIDESILFIVILFCIVCVAPTWRWLLQGQKEIIGGPWEIAHIDPDQS